MQALTVDELKAIEDALTRLFVVYGASSEDNPHLATALDKISEQLESEAADHAEAEHSAMVAEQEEAADRLAQLEEFAFSD